jgi:hypothetical protein
MTVLHDLLFKSLYVVVFSVIGTLETTIPALVRRVRTTPVRNASRL